MKEVLQEIAENTGAYKNIKYSSGKYFFLDLKIFMAFTSIVAETSKATRAMGLYKY